jgi:hypothetical protein
MSARSLMTTLITQIRNIRFLARISENSSQSVAFIYVMYDVQSYAMHMVFTNVIIGLYTVIISAVWALVSFKYQLSIKRDSA